MKVLVDMNMSTRWVDALREQGIVAVHWSTLGEASSSDEEIMRYASAHGHVVLTRDIDFSTILAATSGVTPSVIHLRRQDRFSEDFARLVASAMRQVEHELAAGAVLSLKGSRMRVRRLPIGNTASD
jgi:predicted nuclease of predicted toxin-antitoxin system